MKDFTKEDLVAFVAVDIHGAAKTLAFGGLVGLSALCSAQEGGLEEVIVSATKRSVSTQDVPIAVTALTSKQLIQEGVLSALDLHGLAPSTQVSQTDNALQISIRGIGNDIISRGLGEPGVGFHANGVYVGSQRAALAAFLDVAQVEVLRGPQGTLWGRNATGGVVNVIQKRPTEELDGYVRAEVGRFNKNVVEAAVGGTLIDGAALGRIAVKYSKSDGYLNNLSGGSDLGDDDSKTIRGSVIFNLSDNVELYLAAGYNSTDIFGSATKNSGTAEPDPAFISLFPGILTPVSPAFSPLSVAEAQYGPLAPVEGFDVYQTASTSVDHESSYVTAELNVEFEAVTLTSITSYLDFQQETLGDSDRTNSPVESFFSSASEDTQEFSQEIRLTSTGSGPWEWLAGVYYFESDLDTTQWVTSGPFPSYTDPFGLDGFFGFSIPWPQATILSGGKLESKSMAVFGNSTYHLTDDLGITLGLRYSKDEKDTVGFSGFAFGPPAAVPTPTDFSSQGNDWDNLSGSIGVDYRLDEDTLLYAKVSEGYRAGGINLDNDSGFDEESVLSYEFGLKSSILDGRGQLNMSAYYTDYEDYHIQYITGFAFVIGNSDAEIKGIELELDLIANDNFDFNMSAAWIDSEITSFGDNSVINPANNTPASTGGPTPRTPEFQYSLTGQYHVPVTASGNELSLRLKYYWQDDVVLDPFGTVNSHEDAYGSLDAGLALTDASGQWSVELFGKNLTDEFIRQSLFYGPISVGSPATASISPPRTYGIRFNYNFGS